MYRRGPYMRRRGFPLLFPMGGFGMGMGMGGYGSSLLGDLAAGGIGYLMGRQSAPAPQYPSPTVAPNQQAPVANSGNERLAQLKLLGHLRESGLLTNDEFEVEKQ